MTVEEFKMQLALGTLSYTKRVVLARTPTTPKEILDIIYRREEDDSNYLRNCVAANPNYKHPKNRPGGFGPENK